MSNAISEPAVRSRNKTRRVRRTVTAAGMFILFVLLFLRYIGVFGGNIRTVVPGQVYRSAQLTGSQLNSVLTTDHIRTIVNLRGGTMRDPWYREEVAACKRLGIDHVDVPLSARLLPPPGRLQELLAAFDQDPYPILFHCQGGADRSGLAGVLYLTLYKKVPLDVAEASQLTWRYGHISWGVAHAMDDFFRLYRKTSHGMNLRDWIDTRYPTLYADLPSDQKMTGPDIMPVAHSTAARTVPAATGRRALSSGG
jgi:protein tyrosine phosphatase (PTP) superfamily phosphohydrolase (DUF442 family)